MRKPFKQSNKVGKAISIIGLVIAFFGVVLFLCAVTESGARLLDYYGIAFATYYFVVPGMGFAMIGLGEIIRLLDNNTFSDVNRYPTTDSNDAKKSESSVGGRFAQ